MKLKNAYRAISTTPQVQGFQQNIAQLKSVLPNLCAAAHKYATRAAEVCRGRMSEIKVSMRSFNEIFNSHLKLLIFYIRLRHTSTALTIIQSLNHNKRYSLQVNWCSVL